MNTLKRATYLAISWIAGTFLLPLPAVATPVDPALPQYEPHSVDVLKTATYLTPDGSIRIAGAEHAKKMIEGFDELFIRSHPGSKFDLDGLKGTTIGMPALTHGVTAFAPMGRDATDVELVPYTKIVGTKPLVIRVAHATHTSRKPAQTLAIYVNKANPVEKLTMQQVTRIFTTGHTKGDIVQWSQVGSQGEWAKLPIHPIGTPAYTGFGSYMEKNHFGGLPYRPGYETCPDSAEIVKRVGEDPTGIGFASISFVSPSVKIVALTEKDGGYYSNGSVEDSLAGKYPLERFLYFFVRKVEGQPIDPFIREYFRLIFSKEGQQIVASENDPSLYIPLTAREAAEELAKLE
ncbi:MAG TPA: substrate-binding domain-containing protein [Opitutaceae bacterium]|nr:substrate-binding domain-containing protein [Opitutaceae bacterium]